MTPERLARPDVERLELAEIPLRGRMLVVAPSHRSGAATADASFRWTERSLLTAQTEGQIHRVGLRAVRHRTPALEPRGARAPIELNTDLGDHARAIGHFAGLRIDVDQRLVADIGRPNECTGLAIE